MWKHDKPTTPGYYWIKNDKYTDHIRLIKIWKYQDGDILYTNEDGGVCLDDPEYDNYQFSKEIKPPK
jgi:hypothetical protein